MRLPNGFGSVYKLSGNRRNPYAARKTIGWNAKAQPVYEFIGFYHTKKEAIQALAEYNQDPLQISEHITLEELFERWSEDHFDSISLSHANGIKAVWKICDPIKDMDLKDAKLMHFQKVFDESGKNEPTLRRLKGTLGMMYDFAVKNELAAKDKRDMIRYIDLKKAENPNAVKRIPFSKEEIQLLWDNQKSESIQMILMMIYTGLRIGELLDLVKDDVHLNERWLFIPKAKTPAGTRQVPIAEKIVPIMEKWMEKDSAYLVCTTLSCKKFKYNNWHNSYWKPTLESLGMEHTPHDTRHTCISLLTEAEVDERIIKQIVGHKGQGVTESVYTHIPLDKKIDAINKI